MGQKPAGGYNLDFLSSFSVVIFLTKHRENILDRLYETAGDKSMVLVSISDLSGLHKFGNRMADALSMAQDAIEMWLWDAENNRVVEPLPAVLNPYNIRT